MIFDTIIKLLDEASLACYYVAENCDPKKHNLGSFEDLSNRLDEAKKKLKCLQEGKAVKDD